MRSAELTRALALLAVCGAGLVGCASSPLVPRAEPAGQAAAKPAVAAASTASVAAAAAPAPAPEPEVAVSPAAQRAYDEARRALRAGRMADAERDFKALIQFHPELGGPHANLGLIYRQAGKLNESAAALEQAVKLSPRQPLFHNQLGVTYRHQGQFTKAREAYERAIELDSSYAAATLNLAILFDIYLWDGARALDLYNRYLALTPAGDAAVTKWVADLKNRKPAATAAAAAPRKEKE